MPKGDYSFRFDRVKAERVLCRMVPDKRVLAALGRLVQEVVDEAASTAPDSWCLRLGEHDMFLNVGQVLVLGVKRGGITLYTTQFARRPPQLLSYWSERGVSVYDAVKVPSSRLVMNHERLLDIEREIVRNLRAFVRAAAVAKTRSPWKTAHSPAAIEVLGAAGNIKIEQPGYWNGVERQSITLEYSEGLAHDINAMRDVEQAAIAYVRTRYEKQGWRVVSREADKIGFDLDCRRRHEIRHVEVKGRSTSGDTVILTNGEWDRARKDDQWRLAIVSFAGSKKQSAAEYTGQELPSAFTFEPIAFRLSRGP